MNEESEKIQKIQAKLASPSILLMSPMASRSLLERQSLSAANKSVQH